MSNVKPKKARPIRLYLRADPTLRPTAIEYIRERLTGLPEDKDYRVTISQGVEARREAANSLMWCWNAEIAEFTKETNDENADHWHAYNKLYVLLPLMCHHEKFERLRDEGQFLETGIRAMPTPEHKFRAAYDLIRSSELHVDEFALYLKAVQRHWALIGLALTVKNDHYDNAMGERKAA